MTRWLKLAGLAISVSTARLPAVAVVLVGSVLVFIEPAETSRWIGSYPDTGMYLSVVSFAIAGSLFAVSGYWTGSTKVARAHELARSPRTADAVLGLRALGDLLWLLGGLAVVHVAALTRTFLAAGGFSAVGWSLAVLGFSSATLCYAGGLVAGVLLRHLAGLFVIAPLPYALALGAGEVAIDPHLSNAQGLVGPFIDQSWGLALSPNHATILLLAAYCVLLTAALLAFAARRISTIGTLGARRRVWIPLLAAGAAGAVIFTAVPATAFYTARSTGYACSSDEMVCAWSRGSAGITTWEDAHAQALELLGSIPHQDLAFTEFGVPVRPGFIVLPTPPGDVDQSTLTPLMLDEFVTRMALGCVDGGTQARAQVAGLLSKALQDRAPQDYVAQATAALRDC